MKNKTLFIGCGGSGIKTLQRINELLAGNPETRQIMRENISYMIFDLDVSETENFKDNIRKQVGNAGMPFIKAVQVTRNVTNLEEIVKPSFDEFKRRSEDETQPPAYREEAKKQLARLKQNWWYSPDFNPDKPDEKVPSIPFRAQNIVEGLNQGAGQCGPVSFLATWNYLPHLKEDLEEIVDAIKIRNTDAQGVGLNVVIVAGTAGGTGRGCWQPIAFKVSQTLREWGFVNNPIGVFFDSTCFKNVVEASPNERLNLGVNSLTAMSELSAWMMQPVIRTFQFALPSLAKPSTELIVPGNEPPEGYTPEQKKKWYDARGLIPYTGSTDVIAVPPDGDNELAPITTAYLIFGGEGQASLENNNQYHEMAAAALYAMVAQDEFIGPGAVNRHESVRSFGAITFEVPTIPIRRYMEALVRDEYSKTLYMAAEPRPEDKKAWKSELENAYILDDEAKQLVGVKGGNYSDVDEKDQPFFEKTKFCVDEPVKMIATVVPSRKKATLIQQLMASFAEADWGWSPDAKQGDDVFAFPTPTDALVEALNSQDPDEVKACAEEALALADFDNAAIEEALLKNEALAKLKIDEDNLKKIIKDTVRGAFAPEKVISCKTNSSMEPSVGRALAALRLMRARIVTSIANLGRDLNEPFGVTVGDGVVLEKHDDCAVKFASEVVDKYAVKKFYEFKRFNKKKIGDICREFQDYLTAALYFKISKALAAKFRKALELLNEIEVSLNTLVEGLQKVGKYFEDELCKACGVKNGDVDKAYRELFIEEDEDAVFKSLPKMDAKSNLYKRILKPIMSRERVKKLVQGSTDKNEKPIRECLTKFVREIIKGEAYPTPEDARDAIRQEFSGLIATNVSLRFENNTDFMTRNFSFAQVLRNNLQYWNALLKARAGSEDILGELKDRLRKYLGVTENDYERDDGKIRIPYDSLWEGIVASMAGDCKPWMKLEENARETYLNAIALIPTDESDLDAEELRNHVKQKYPGKVLNVYMASANGKHSDSIPKDRIIVFTAMAVSVQDDENPFGSIKSLNYYQDAEFSRLLVRAEDDVNLLSYFYPIKNNPAARVKWGEQRDTHGYVSPIFIKEPGLASTRWRPWKRWNPGVNAEAVKADDVANAMIFGFIGAEGSLSPELSEKLTTAGWKGVLLGKGKTAESVMFCRGNTLGDIAWAENDEVGLTITAAKRFLAGEGRSSQKDNGAIFERSIAKGNACRKAILMELEAFRTQVSPNVGNSVLDEVNEALGKWLLARYKKDTGADKQVWEDLYNRVNGKKFLWTSNR